MTLMTNDLNSSGPLRTEVHGLRLRWLSLIFLCCRLFVYIFFVTWFDLFTQLSYPILRIFGEEVEESFWLEDLDDMYERFLPERAEVRDLSFPNLLGSFA